MKRGSPWRAAGFGWLAVITLITQKPDFGQVARPMPPVAVRTLELVAGRSLNIDSPAAIKRVANVNEALVDCVAIGPHELLLNAKAPGETSIVVWRDDGTRVRYDVTVIASPSRLNAIERQIERELPGVGISITVDNDTAFVRGVVKDIVSAERVMAIASTLGKTVNLLRVATPPAETQVLLKVRFANVGRTVSRDLGLSIASGAFNQTTAIGTGPPISVNGGATLSLSQAMNLLLFRKDIDIAAALQALENKRMLEILAEPNLLTINGVQATFVAGGEFPYPIVQPGAGANSLTIAFKEYGIRLAFLPLVTPRGTIHLQVAPEVSSLDYNNSVTVGGTVVPGTSTRRVQTEVELESGQSFAIAGLLDRSTSESLSKVPGLAAIPVLGKLFQSKSISRNDSELLILITPEIVRPISSGQKLPEIPGATLRGGTRPMPMEKGPVPSGPLVESIPVEVFLTPPKKMMAPVGPPGK